MQSWASPLSASASGAANNVLPFARVAGKGAYPSLRRAQRLSYAVWAVIGPGVDLQPLLEAGGAAERLRLALRRLRELDAGVRRGE